MTHLPSNPGYAAPAKTTSLQNHLWLSLALMAIQSAQVQAGDGMDYCPAERPRISGLAVSPVVLQLSGVHSVCSINVEIAVISVLVID